MMVTAKRSEYGNMPDGSPVAMFTLRNSSGTCIRLIEYGGITAGIELPDCQGRIADVTLGYDDLAGWQGDRNFIGATMGRYANRIGGASFEIDGAVHRLQANENGNQLHGGDLGFHKVLWSGEIVHDTKRGSGVCFRLLSPDGDQGYPGTLSVSATHWLTLDNTLRIEYVATTDKPTVVNLTHHSYWNLSGRVGENVLDHELTVCADEYTPLDDASIPTGEIASVAGAPLDFRNQRTIGARIGELFGGYDHNFVLRAGDGVRQVARLAHAESGRTVDILSDAPGMQMYTANAFDEVIGKNGLRYKKHCAVALEPQSFPDSPNKPAFPNTVLRPGETYDRTIEFGFGVEQ